MRWLTRTRQVMNMTNNKYECVDVETIMGRKLFYILNKETGLITRYYDFQVKEPNRAVKK